ncbi:MAG TPA: kelch repeat-containing protein, partial [Planctomycetota bacterium]|nr:kelch repeat-containing protein [Planctomycetota bacterium]
PRARHTATGLPDGTVLLVGGADDGGTALASAERFFPSLGTFQATRGSLEVARQGHQATPFGAGRVLITGGGTDAVEVYYAQSSAGSQTLDPIASPAYARTEHRATTLADGRVLVTGGTNGVVDASGIPVALATAEIVDAGKIASQRTTPLPATMSAARRRHTATLLDDGTVLLAGGIDASGARLASLELFDPATLTFTALADALPIALSDHTATRLDDGKVLIAGGLDAGGAPSAAAFIFDRTATPRVSTLTASLLTPRAGHTATLMPETGKVLIAGGATTAGAPTASAEVFTPATTSPAAAASFAAAGDLGIARFDHAAVRLDDGTVLVAGGRGDGVVSPMAPTADVRRFDPSALTFTALAPMLSPRADFVAISIPGSRATFAGGISGTNGAGSLDLAEPITASAETYSPSAGGTSTATLVPLSSPRRGMRAAALGDGTTVISGGRREAGIVVPAGDRFTP